MLLSIVLVNFRQADQTIDCIRSLEKNTMLDFQTIIVDNQSTPESAEKLKRHCPNSTVIPVPENLGFAEGNNLGIRFALQSDSELILLLNNDTIAHRDLLKTLVNTAISEKTAGVVGAKIYFYDDPKMLWYAGGRLVAGKALATHRGLKQEDDGSFDVLEETDFVTGCCLMTKREVVQKIGFLDAGFFLYYEDVDFCLRAKEAGYSVLYQPAATLYHKVSASTEWDSPVYIYFNLRNKILFLRKHTRPSVWIANLPYLVYFYGRQFIRLIFKHRNFRAAEAALFGLSDGLKGFTGEHGKGRLSQL